MLHLHRLENEQGLTRADGLAGLDHHGDDAPRHGRGEPARHLEAPGRRAGVVPYKDVAAPAPEDGEALALDDEGRGLAGAVDVDLPSPAGGGGAPHRDFAPGGKAHLVAARAGGWRAFAAAAHRRLDDLAAAVATGTEANAPFPAAVHPPVVAAAPRGPEIASTAPAVPSVRAAAAPGAGEQF